MSFRDKFKTNEEYNKYFRNYREKNREKIRIYNREYNKQWREKNGYHNEHKWTDKNPEKIKAQRLAQYALRNGYIERKSCKECGNKKSEMHHSDYTKPLNVIFLCRIHHTEEHRKLSPHKSNILR
ncbi:hypothetical protein LCGC14_0896940 [marine sediment metagenome]|uniref:Uncharacterized protein n=1 Tax=marine sediment metagenome TaxID=412755 RepID=A0A0F9P2F8_9ZZZZ